MRYTTATCVVLLAGLAGCACLAAEPDDGPKPPHPGQMDRPPHGDRPFPPPRPPKAEEGHRRGIRPPHGQGPHGGPGIRPPHRGGPPRRPDGGPMHPPHAIMGLIHEHRPDLAERLVTLFHKSPDEFHRVLVETLVFHIEQPLEEAEERAKDRGVSDDPPHPPKPEGPRKRPSPPPEHHQKLQSLHDEHDQLDARSRELAEQLRDLRAHDAPQSEQKAVHDRLLRVVNEQFEVRTQLRRLELERIEQELRELENTLERMRDGLKRRDSQRSDIIDRRVRQLVTPAGRDW